MKPFATILALLLSSALFLSLPAVTDARPDKIRVVMDDNYPPFSFRNSEGKQQGILIDQWQLWEQKTGIKVEITAMDWSKALGSMKAGEFDVIDTIFKNKERSGWLDFTEPYASLKVPIFFDKEVSGITDAASLKGFVVAAKRGDNAVDILKRSGVENLLLFNNYEEIVRAAKDHKATVFVIDEPPARYFLHKMGILNNYKQSNSLYAGEFHRAVTRGQAELLKTVADGFRLITADELHKLDNKWYGVSLGNNSYTRAILIGVGLLSLLVFGLYIWNRTLKKSVEKRTAELRVSEANLRENEEKFKAFFEQGYYFAGLMALDGTLTDVNSRALQFSGVEKKEVVGKPFWEAPWWNHSPDLQEKLRRGITTAAGGEIVTFEATHPASDGSIHYVDFSLRPVKNDAGTVVFLVPEGRDITDQKKAEENRLNLERQLLHTQKLESLGVLSGGIAHDFNNLLQALLGNLEIALRRLPQETSARRNIDQAINTGRKAAELTAMMLAYSGKGLFDIKPLNLTRLVEENAAMLEAAISKTITLEQDLDKHLPDIKADAGQLQQVIMNLITNAAEAIGDQCGKISFSTGMNDFDQATLDNSRLEEKQPAGSYVWMKVCDSGCGMDGETLHKLFDPFFTTKFTGRGLGMAAVLGIIRAHKGTFLVESKPGSGTAIQVLFPVANGKAGGSDAAETAETVAIKAVVPSLRVLVVDDEEMICDVSTAMLQELGYETLTAGSGEEALTLFCSAGNSIGVVLLDQVMPGMDGVTVFRELRRIRPEIKVILASGFSQQEIAERYSGLGLNGFLPKPYTLKNLTDELSKVLKERD